MEKISINIEKALGFIEPKQWASQEVQTMNCIRSLHLGTGKGNEFLGWLHLPSSISMEEMISIQTVAQQLRNTCEVIVVVGIGGSYLGTKAIIDALDGSFDYCNSHSSNPIILYAGHHMSEDYFYEMQQFLATKKFGIIHISKSGTTTEPALAFRILKNQLETAVGKIEAKNRIIAVTDEKKGALRSLVNIEGYQSFIIPDNIGGRFSVLSSAGLLPIAIAGIDIEQLIAGAIVMEKETAPDVPVVNNISALYAMTRYLLYKQGKKIEILANFNPKLHYISEWWKQLFAESEGKENKGIFTASVDFTTDLHSMGQWIQEGERSIFETVISVTHPNYTVEIPVDPLDLDGLNYLTGKRVDDVNKMAELGTQMAHVAGGVPIIKIELPQLNAYYLGQLIYFFEKACGISGYLLGVNPFDQPGVEAYKKNMFALFKKA